jgi:hypothetical protein
MPEPLVVLQSNTRFHEKLLGTYTEIFTLSPRLLNFHLVTARAPIVSSARGPIQYYDPSTRSSIICQESSGVQKIYFYQKA